MKRKRFTAKQKADMDMFLSMREISEVTGFGENRLNEIKKRPGFPLFAGKTTLAKFREWAFAHSSPAKEIAHCSQKPLQSPHPTAGRCYEPFR
jgi:hypothetical protein